jgi:hypothetical protein
MPGTVTIAFNVRNSFTLAPAAGRVRVVLPQPLSDTVTGALYGPVVGAWADLVAGVASVTFVDPHDPDLVPTGWAPVIEIDTDVLKARYPVVIPPGSAGETLPLGSLSDAVEIELTAYALWNHTHEGGGSGGVPETRQVIAGTGLQGGGTLAVDRTVSLSLGSQSAIALANTAVQPATLDTVEEAVSVSLDALNGAIQTKAPKVRAVSTGLVTGTFGPAGDSGAWTLCPAGYRVTVPAAVGDVLRWSPAFYHGSDQESMGDLASVVGGAPARYLSSGTAVQGAVGHGALYIAATGNRTLRAVDWVVTADDLDAGNVTLAFMYRNTGSGNTLGHGSIPGQVDVINLGGEA